MSPTETAAPNGPQHQPTQRPNSDATFPLGEDVGDVRERLRSLDTKVRRAVTRQPLVAIVGALLLGLAVGRAVRR